ncbi:Amino-acid acetyltransferase mitochondrial [Penicillium canariense]|uniref:Protein ARV n=1 Tax=Penicillium canariense TaxID=189055 RepID=A0A9W9IEX1_9EURO|nr:Amino-acid acetyltransferase mitochondrial [Penicillium canariense]KAJ5175950.1 Amino-acid acetyltransferase mitochondrial [Penicillium canariense]
MSSRAFHWPRTAPSALAKRHVACTKEPAVIRPAQSLQIRAQQHAEFSNTTQNHERLGHRAKEKLLDKEFFLSLLSSASTKREAKSYLSRFKNSPPNGASEPASEPPKEPSPESLPSGVNLGSFYGASRAVYDSPVFRQNTTPAPREREPSESLHLALVKITTPQSLDDDTLSGVAKTLSQLVRLGMACCVVVDPGNVDGAAAMRQVAIEQANRLSTAVDEQPDSKSFRLDSALSLSERGPGHPTVMSRKGLLSRLRAGHVVIVTPIAYMEENPRAVSVSANDAVMALTKEFAGLSTDPDPDEDPAVTAERISNLQKEVSLDRVILLHPLGGIPAFRGPQTSHVFINMEQEFDDINEELLDTRSALGGEGSTTSSRDEGPASAILHSNPFSKFVDQEVISPLPSHSHKLPGSKTMSYVIDGHLENLRLSQQTLAMLPSASSGIITSPQEVANSARAPQEVASDVSAVGTRRQRNPLIHNLLTDKPLLSSSLPPGRRGTINGCASAISHLPSHTTFVKRGMPLTILPNPHVQMWTAQGQSRLQLNDPSIDLPRLVHLIEDSFDRKLDIQNYLERVNDRIAGLIIAGEYEGGAILTWEAPPGVVDDGSKASAARLVPYLDKFAVLKRSQGAGGVADIVFNAMVRTCFPDGVCWRSRKDNPVNKWYFERSSGTWKLSDSNWTMFWTTPGLVEDTRRFQDYEALTARNQRISPSPPWRHDTMPICIECSYPVSHLYSAYSRADDRSQGKGVRLTQCPRCQRFADKYVEYDFVVIFIDLVLIKPQVYRHLLFNRLGRDDNRFDRSIIRLGILLLLFDVYLTWARLEKDPSLATTFISRAPIVIQYLFFLTLNAATTLAHHLTVRLLASILVPKSHRYGAPETSTQPSTAAGTGETTPFPSGPPTPTIRPSPPSQATQAAQQLSSIGLPAAKLTPNPAFLSDTTSPPDPSPIPQAPSTAPQRPPPPLRRTSTAPIQNIQPLPPPTAASPTAISTALLVSSCAKLFPILLVIWGADGSGNSTSTSAAESAFRKDLGASKAALSSARDAASSPSFLESYLAAAESLLRPYLPTRYVTGLFELLASLLSLGVVDAHLVLLSNIEALYILLGCGYLRSVAVAVAGQVARWAVQRIILGAVGVG